MSDSMMMLDGFDDCCIGLFLYYGGRVPIYDLKKVIRKLQKQGMTEPEAYEYFEYNMLGAYVGAGTPGYLDRMTAKQVREIEG